MDFGLRVPCSAMNYWHHVLQHFIIWSSMVLFRNPEKDRKAKSYLHNDKWLFYCWITDYHIALIDSSWFIYARTLEMLQLQPSTFLYKPAWFVSTGGCNGYLIMSTSYGHTVILHQLIGGLSHYSQGFNHPFGGAGFLPPTVGQYLLQDASPSWLRWKTWPIAYHKDTRGNPQNPACPSHKKSP